MTSYSSFMLRNVKFRVEECVMIKSSQVRRRGHTDDRGSEFEQHGVGCDIGLS